MFTTDLKSGAFLRGRRLAPASMPDRLPAHAVIAATSFVAYILARLAEGPVSAGFAAFGVSACGWAWLLARALFDPARHDAAWPRLVVGVLTVAGAVSVLAPDGGLTARVADNLYALSGSAALILTLVEPFQRHGCALSRAETRFRIAFGLGFALLAGVSVIGIWMTPEPIQTVSAVISLAGAGAATAYRLRHPLRAAASPPAPRKPATDEDHHLAARLLRLLQDEAIHTDPDLRIGDVADRLGQPEYRVSRCISAGLGFANFNRLINHHRIADAQRLLSDSSESRSILEIALDCGFASLGPFNRAFKEETGTTPRAYRTHGAGGRSEQSRA
ncbi:MAG: helix-turn-helix transcriptional regulator [Brevundimonas sp.]|uniref:helix-turn-helix transcriptional regulator n=1 Tax=Brevundimonas sp. TaxID=1871086 RepID=UPI0025B8A901|nr:AraC family transcriptional regulator [Brevundimonas sp.]MBX3476694.1 helix-turn-helix transcriptional regulator [Brevundimonas sp.]